MSSGAARARLGEALPIPWPHGTSLLCRLNWGSRVPAKQSQLSEGVSGPPEPPRSQLDWSPRSGPTAGSRGQAFTRWDGIGTTRTYLRPCIPQLVFFLFCKQLLLDVLLSLMWLTLLLKPSHGLRVRTRMNHALRAMTCKCEPRSWTATRGCWVDTSSHDGSTAPSTSNRRDIFPCLGAILRSGSCPCNPALYAMSHLHCT